MDFETAYHPEILGEYAERQQSKNRLLAVAALSIIGIFLILYADFDSLRLSLLVILCLPFALTGSIFAALVSGGVLSLGSIVGFITVLGIVGRNGIMLFSHYCQLEAEENMPFGEELIIRGARERLSPILMTVLTTALYMLDYPRFKQCDYDIGSGPTEAFCKSLTSRLKCPGMRWDKHHAEAIMALASVRSSHLWQAYWQIQRKTPA
ncbi:MAG: efflux RND transporter permease subunit [Sedimentisphaerales bacterium]